ncbi:tyrosine-type recombinase/integrase [Roseateles sp. LKC17W]|uniref:Tyrosine-type recombinase/integrase n=1 Tax=Pelomonas margarita TaxID=3299031 RepID=A0ABW7FMI0_9BURK
MAKHLIPSDATLRAIKPGDVRKRINDGDGLYLQLFVNGGSHGWRFAYSLATRRNILSLGTYPDVSLSQARKRADEARKLVSEGLDPSSARKASKAAAAEKAQAERLADAGLPAAGSFEAVAREWFDTRRAGWSTSYGDKIMARLEADVFPVIGRLAVGSITSPELLVMLRKIEARGVIETAHRARENCSQVFRFAVATGRAERDPAQDLKDGLKRPDVKHFPAITEPARLAELLRAFDGYAGTYVVRAALRLVPMLLLRPGELRQARWDEFDLDGATWTIPAHRMKREKAGKKDGPPHLVPLPRQAVAVLRELERVTGRGELVFRGERHHDRPMSENTVNAAMRAMGFPKDEVTGHGFRATARTMLAERLGVDIVVIEAQLAHSVKDSLGRAYNRTQYLDQRRAMMQTWADYLDRLRQGADVAPIGRAA